jgi:hypothetical protein
MATMYENLCGNCVGRIELTVHSRAILKVVKSMYNFRTMSAKKF